MFFLSILQTKELPTFKDNDFLEGKCKLFLPDDAKEKLINMLVADAEVRLLNFVAVVPAF